MSRSNPPRQVAQAAPAARNASRVTGELLSVETVDSTTLQIAPPQTLTRIRVRILSVEPVGTMVDALDGQKGKVLESYTKEAVEERLIGKNITCVVTLRADERGGKYWAGDIKESPRQ